MRKWPIEFGVILLLSLVVIIGLALGSFLGACVYRIPRGISVIRPGSFCPHCKTKLQWRDLVPVLSPILNGWKCRRCGMKISSRYTAIEIVTTLVLVLVVLSSDWDTGLFGRCAFVLTLIPLIWIDWEFFRIPNGILVFGASATILVQLLVTPADVVSHLSSAVAALVIMGLVRVLGGVLFRKPALGMGDVKLSGFVALQLGFTGFLGALWLGAIGALVYVTLAKSRSASDSALVIETAAISVGREAIPFGSFLCAASIFVLVTFDKLETLLSAWLISIS
jgi:leader peptidase (prepilin peptidase)/N-methyltransferase